VLIEDHRCDSSVVVVVVVVLLLLLTLDAPAVASPVILPKSQTASHLHPLHLSTPSGRRGVRDVVSIPAPVAKRRSAQRARSLSAPHAVDRRALHPCADFPHRTNCRRRRRRRHYSRRQLTNNHTQVRPTQRRRRGWWPGWALWGR
jgi:hypothetical protein